MTLVVKDRVKETAAAPGTGAVTLGGAAAGFQAFSAIGDGNTTYFTIVDPASGAWEVNSGTYTAAGTTLSRNATPLSSSAAGALVNFTGSVDVFCTYPSEVAATAQVGDILITSDSPTGPGTWLETGKYYSKAAYPDLATKLGDFADIGAPAAVPQAQLPTPFAAQSASTPYMTATNGVVTVAVGADGAIRLTTDGVNWTSVPSTTTLPLVEVRYLNGNFVAVGNNGGTGVLVTSADGTTWVQRAIYANPNSAPNGSLKSVAYGAGKYVAVGANNTILYSSDLETWTEAGQANLNATTLNRVVFGGGRFVAVGSTGATFSSIDGVSWTYNRYTVRSLFDVVYANSLFVTVDDLGGSAYSQDGISWASANAQYSSPPTSSPFYNYSVTATNGTTTVLVGAGVGYIFKTTDGLNWYQVLSPSTGPYYEVRYLNGNFVAVGSSGLLASSSDGTTWTRLTVPTSAALHSVAYGNGKYVAVGASGTIIYSSDLVTWTLASGTGANTFVRMVYANSLFVAVGAGGAVYTSPDGITWTSRSAGSSQFYDLVYANSLFVAVGGSGAVYTSSNGTTWTSRSAGSSKFSGVTYGNGLYVAISTLTGVVGYTSPDGVTWTIRSMSATLGGSVTGPVAWTGTQFIALGNAGIWMSSPDGITWSKNVDASLTLFTAIATVNGITIGFGTTQTVTLEGAARTRLFRYGSWQYNPSALNTAKPRFIAGNGSGQYAVLTGSEVLTSSDGVSWTGRVSGYGNSQGGIFYLNGNYIVFGNSNGQPITYSSNGTTWSLSSTTFTSNFLVAAAYGASTYVIVGGSGAVWSSTDLVTWTSRSAGAADFYDVTYANGVFVAIGNFAGCYTSTDGITWTLRSGIAVASYRVIYANSLFVVVGGAAGQIYTSPDGITWTSRTSNTSNQLNDIAWNGTVFCAVGASNAVVTSPDGFTWAVRPVPELISLTFNSVAWNGSVFVAAGPTNYVCISSDGISWSARYLPEQSPSFKCVAYDGGKFIGVGANYIAASADGGTWTAATNASFNYLSANTITYGNGKFVISGAGNAVNLATSTDGITWTSLFVGAPFASFAQAWYYCLWDGSAYYLVGANGRYATSTDGTTWTAAQDASASTFYSLAVISGKTIAFGTTSSVVLAGGTRAEVLQSGTWGYTVAAQSATNPRTIAYNGTNQYVAVGSNGVFLTSTDGQSWVGSYSGTTTNFDKVQYVNGNYIAMGGAGALRNVATSTDGITWTTRLVGSTARNAVAYGAGVYVMVGVPTATTNTYSIASSTDLSLWTSRLSSTTATFNDVIYANSLFVAVGAAGLVYTSSDGVTWTNRSAGSNNFLRVIYANSLFVAVGAGPVIYTSPDGITWTSRSPGLSDQINDITWNGSLFCVVCGQGNLGTSPDGITWTRRTIGDTSGTLNSVSWSGTRFVVTNTVNGVAWVSTDGITWARSSTVYQGAILYSAYLGGKFLAIGTGAAQNSANGVNWANSDQVQYTPTSVNKIYKYGAYYYVLTNKGIFQSSDGVNFVLASRSISSGAVLSMAYSGSAWLAVSSATSGQPQAFYKSTDGVNWSKSADFGVLTSTSTMAGGVTDLVYASGNFICGQAVTVVQNIAYSIYTSSDGVTWTGRQTPYLALPATAMASDGTTVVFGTNSPANSYKSVNGGVTWTEFPTGGSTSMYVGGVWSLGSLISDDLSTFFSGSFGQSSPYKTGDCIITISGSAIRSISRVGSGGSSQIAVVATNGASVFPVAVNTAKEAVERGTKLLIPVSRSNAFTPNLLAEFPLYSYDTATTFFVLPEFALSGYKSYIYAGA